MNSYIPDGGIVPVEEIWTHVGCASAITDGEETQCLLDVGRVANTVSALIRALGDLHEECDDRCLPEDGPCKYLDLLAALKGEK